LAKFLKSTISLLLILGVSACATNGSSVGKMASSSFSGSAKHKQWPLTGTPADELAAGILSGNLGADLDRNSLILALRSEFVALEKGQTGNPVTWVGSKGVAGKVIPQQVYQVGSSKCRRYDHVITSGSGQKNGIGTACRNAEGVWRPLS